MEELKRITNFLKALIVNLYVKILFFHQKCNLPPMSIEIISNTTKKSSKIISEVNELIWTTFTRFGCQEWGKSFHPVTAVRFPVSFLLNSPVRIMLFFAGFRSIFIYSISILSLFPNRLRNMMFTPNHEPFLLKIDF